MLTRYKVKKLKVEQEIRKAIMSSESESLSKSHNEGEEFEVNNQLGGPGVFDDVTMIEGPVTETMRAGEPTMSSVNREEPAVTTQQLMAMFTAITEKITESSTQLNKQLTDKLEEHTQQVTRNICQLRAETKEMLNDMRKETRELVRNEIDAVKKTLAESVKDVREMMIKEDKELERRITKINKRVEEVDKTWNEQRSIQREEIRQEIKSASDEINVNLSQIGEQLADSITQRKKKEEEVDDRINKMREDQREINSKLAKVSEVPASRGGQVEPTKHVTFSGEEAFPMEFLKELDEIKEVFHGERDTKWVRQYLEKDAALWWRLVKDKISTYSEFREAFTEKFWGPTIQDEARDRLEFGKFHHNDVLNPIQYMQQRILEARQLIPPLTDRHIINKLSRHYSHDVSVAVIMRGIQDIGSFEGLLREFMTVRWQQARSPTQPMPKVERESAQTYSDDRKGQQKHNNGRFGKNKSWQLDRREAVVEKGSAENGYVPKAPPQSKVIETDVRPSTSKADPTNMNINRVPKNL